MAMLRTGPLSSIANESTLSRKRYGKKIKHGNAAIGAKDIFVNSADLEQHFQQLTICDLHGLGDQDAKVELSQGVVAAHEPDSTAKHEPKNSTAISEAESGHRRRSPKAKHPAKRHPASSKTASKLPPQDARLVDNLSAKFCDRGPLSFESYGKKIARACNVEKIGEGAYSSVFALSANRSECQDSQHWVEMHATTIIKLMPILLSSTGDQPGQTEPVHIANELETMQTLDSVHGFIRYRGLTIVHGSWPANFLAAFRKFRAQHRVKAENEDPEDAYPPNQYYALVEMEDAGQEVSDVLGGRKGKRPSLFQIWDVIWQTCIHLAQAESQCGFEHRDLHVSNICVKPKPDSDHDDLDISQEIVANMSRATHLLGLTSLQVTLIDYTFSRAEISRSTMASKVNFRAFVLEGEEYTQHLKSFLRDAKQLGSSGIKIEDALQQLTYAKVAHCVAQQRSTKATGTDDGNLWEQSTPITNVCWLGYLTACLMSRAGKTIKTRYVAGSCDAAKSMQDEIYMRLQKLKRLLLHDDIKELPRSADDVLRLGLQNGWIGKEELEQFKTRLEEES